MLLDSSDYFHYQVSQRRKNRSQLAFILDVFGANVIVLLSYAFNFKWWEMINEKWLIAIGFIYVFSIMALYQTNKNDGASLFSDGFLRLKHWRDFYRSDIFSKRVSMSSYEHAPISHGDYVCLKKGHDYEYAHFEAESNHVGKDIDSNRVFNRKITLTELKKDKVLFEKSEQTYLSFADLLADMQEKLEKDGYQIEAIYNKFGDVKWSRSDIPSKRSKYRVAHYYVAITLWHIAALIAFIAPIIPLFQEIFEAM